MAISLLHHLTGHYPHHCVGWGHGRSPQAGPVCRNDWQGGSLSLPTEWNAMSITLFRTLEMLRHVPREPRKITTSELRDRLAAANFDVTLRTIQRDLQKLSTVFPLISDERDHVFGWSWSRDAQVETLPGMDAATAITFAMAEEYLRDMLPSGVLELLAPHFDQARRVLDATDNGLNTWKRKVRVLPRSQPLIAPDVDPEIAQSVYDALLNDRRLKAVYRPRGREPREYDLSPQGLAFRDAVTYLVASHRDYDNVLMFALHRFLHADVTDEPARHLPGFDFDEWVQRGGFDADRHGEAIQLVAQFDMAVGDHLHETPIADDQHLARTDDDRLELIANVKDTHQLRWWLRGFGPDVEVIEPAEIRDWLIEGARQQISRYADASSGR
ncbi:YafY family protein [Guyparkeria sp. SCN-R1]|uniref:helix-turn-helix transcriptional regulator n=1 Tax=Guyparkeria sp. SCN-R1 TaxID=2341113 RepID=UPI000F6517FA|nr:WYL domain-containing protein [Guyparkeria sp. SCN-R1]